MSKFLILPELPNWHLSDEEIEYGMQLPIQSEIKCDIAIRPEKDTERVNNRDRSNRVLAQGIATWKASSGMPLAGLIKLLLLKYFMGEVYYSETKQTPVKRIVVEYNEQSEDDIDLSDVDTSTILNDEYEF